MNLAQAGKTFGLSFPYTAADVKKTYRALSSKNHPDNGGNDDDMAQINVAYSILKDTNSSQPYTLNWKEIRERNELKASDLTNVIKNTFNVSAFLAYFRGFTGEDFEYIIHETSNQWNGGINVKFFNKDKTTVFTFAATASTNDRSKPSFSGNNENISFELGITAFGYINRKKIKMARRDWAFDNDHAALFDPSKSFGRAKLVKAFSQPKTTDMKKADFQLALEYELNAKHVSDVDFIPLGDDYFLKVYRMVWNRVPAWTFCGISYKQGFTYKNTNHRVYHTFYENSEAIDTLLKLKALGTDFDTIAKVVEVLK